MAGYTAPEETVQLRRPVGVIDDPLGTVFSAQRDVAAAPRAGERGESRGCGT